MFGPDGRLYACQNDRKRIVAYDSEGKESVVAEGLGSNDLVVNHKGELYVTDPASKQVWFISATGEKRVVDTGITEPNGVILTPDQSLLLVADTQGQLVYSFQVQPDGSLADKQPYFYLHVARGLPAQRRRRNDGRHEREPVRGHGDGRAVLRSAGARERHPAADPTPAGSRTSPSAGRTATSSTSRWATPSSSARPGRRASSPSRLRSSPRPHTSDPGMIQCILHLRLFGVVSLLLTAPVGGAPSAGGPSADRVYRNGIVFTADARHPSAEALAIRAGRIVYVGSNSGVTPFVGPKTVSVDLAGRFVMPGIVDGHMHPLEAGTALLKCGLDYMPLTSPRCSSASRRASTQRKRRSRTVGSRS